MSLLFDFEIDAWSLGGKLADMSASQIDTFVAGLMEALATGNPAIADAFAASVAQHHKEKADG